MFCILFLSAQLCGQPLFVGTITVTAKRIEATKKTASSLLSFYCRQVLFHALSILVTVLGSFMHSGSVAPHHSTWEWEGNRIAVKSCALKLVRLFFRLNKVQMETGISRLVCPSYMLPYNVHRNNLRGVLHPYRHSHIAAHNQTSYHLS